MGRVGGTKVTFPPQTHVWSFKHLTVHNDDCKDQHNRSTTTFDATFTLLIIFCIREIVSCKQYILCCMGGPIPSHRRSRFVQLAHGDGGDDVVPTEGPEKNPKARLPSVHRVHSSHVALTWTHANIVGGRITRLHP